MDNNYIKTRQGTFPVTVFEKDIYDVNLPKYLENDIKALLKGIKENSTLLDCLMDEVYGSINGAYWDGQISEEHSNHLREKYLLLSCKESGDKNVR